MSPAEAAIREALAAGPIDGPWVVYPETDGTEICAVDMAPGLQVRGMVARPHLRGKWVANAAHIAACNPAAIRSLLSELDALRARCEAGEALLHRARYVCNDHGVVSLRDDIDAHLKGAGRE